jgi:dTDP-glucose pyrophosphorylase
MTTARAIVLARGLGTRMRAPDASAHLTPEQHLAADAGLKAMIPLNGRPFVDFILSSLADAGIQNVALIVAPSHGALRQYYERDAPPARVRLDFVVQQEAIGTANAVLSAEGWTGGEPFLVVNADNLYPAAALSALAALAEPGLPAFDAEGLVKTSNIPAERIQSFALLDIDAGGYLAGIVEKPSRDRSAGQSRKYVSMNCWRFDDRIFRACREVPISQRGEFELPEAVGVAVRQGIRFKTFAASGPVLDLSTRADAADVARRLVGTTPRP